MKLDTSFTAPMCNRGEVYVKMEEFEKAEKDFSKVIKHDPKSVYANFARGVTYMKDEKYRNAIKDFTKVIKLDPLYVEAYINRGLSSYYVTDYDSAMDDWRYALKLDPSLGPELKPLIDHTDYMRMNR